MLASFLTTDLTSNYSSVNHGLILILNYCADFRLYIRIHPLLEGDGMDQMPLNGLYVLDGAIFAIALRGYRRELLTPKRL